RHTRLSRDWSSDVCSSDLTAGQTIFRGVLLSMLISLVASGLSLIFGLLAVLNFGQGAFVLVGAYVGYATYRSVDLNSTLSFVAEIGRASCREHAVTRVPAS